MARDYPLAAYAARRNPQTKFIATRHVLFPLNRLHRRTLSSASRVIAVSNAVARQLRSRQLVDSKRIAVVLNGVDTKRFHVGDKQASRLSLLAHYGVAASGFLVGSIGELRTLKRHDDFIRAAALLSKKIPACHFVIAGVDTSPKGEVRNKLGQLASELGVSERIHFLGWLEDAPQLLQALDVFVSASETESFGLAIVEAMAAGTPVVATATEGAQEVVDDGITGLRVPIGDAVKLASAVEILLSDEAKRREIGTLARKAAQERFSLERMVDAIERIYMEDYGAILTS
jgi:glycosyltransferase involved in cell wall biosynthesis